MEKKILNLIKRDGKLYLDFGNNISVGETLESLISALIDTCDVLFSTSNNTYEHYVTIKNIINSEIDNVYKSNNNI